MEESPQPSETVGTDMLCIYGFSLSFPMSCELEFDHKFKREEGNLAIKSPSRSVVFVSWGHLRKVVKKLPTPVEHSRFSIERVAKNAQGRLTNIEQKEIKVNGHAAVYNHAKVETPRSLIGGRKRSQEIESLHIHCEKTSRYYVIYTSFDSERLEDPGREDALKMIIGSFKCH